MNLTTKDTKGHERAQVRAAAVFVFFVSFVVPNFRAAGAQD
jgi:hypothetical protein